MPWISRGPPFIVGSENNAGDEAILPPWMDRKSTMSPSRKLDVQAEQLTAKSLELMVRQTEGVPDGGAYFRPSTQYLALADTRFLPSVVQD